MAAMTVVDERIKDVLNDPSSAFVFVINKNEKAHKDSYDGIQYEFKPNKEVLVPYLAAVHMFAYQQNEQAKKEAVARLGKDRRYEENPATKVNEMFDDMEAGLAWLDKFRMVKPEIKVSAEVKDVVKEK